MGCRLSSGIAQTFDTLVSTDNEAAVPLLVSALTCGHREIADGAFRAILRRKPPAVMTDLLSRWHIISPRWKGFAVEKAEAFSPAIREALNQSSDDLIRNATDAILALREYDFVAPLARLAESRGTHRSRVAAVTLLRLSESLYEELHGQRDYRLRRDPQRVRQHVVGSLETAVARFALHQSNEIVEAFLLLTPVDNASLWHFLQDPDDEAHEAVCEQFLKSTRTGVERLLLSLLEHLRAPLSLVKVVAKRCDVGFFRHLCRKLADHPSPVVDGNLAKIESLPWIDQHLQLVESLTGTEQIGLVRLISKTHIPAKQAKRVLERLLRVGTSQGRQAAIQALVALVGEDMQPVLEYLIHDPCPIVQAEAARHLRPCDMPNALTKLIELLEHNHPSVREAAQHSLREFSFERYVDVFDRINAQVRKQSGELVKRVNPKLAESLHAEMLERGRARRLRGMEIAAALELVNECESAIIELCQDEDHAVRCEAARLLQECPSTASRRQLRTLLSDSSSAVANMAEQSLRNLTRTGPEFALSGGGT